MSLCNTFRLFVLSLIIVLSSIDTPVAFTLRRTRSGSQDLAQEEPIVLQLINVNGSNVPPSSDIRRSVVQFDKFHINSSKSYEIEKNKYGDDPKKVKHGPNVNSMESPIENLSNERDTITTMQALAKRSLGDSLMSNTEHFEEKSMFRTKAASEFHLISATEETTTDMDGQSTSVSSSTNDNEFTNDPTNIIPDTTEVTTYEPETTEPELPVWKKYTTIDRKRPLITSNEDISNNKTEEMEKAETKRSRVSLKDTVTSDIPSLDKLKNDLLSSTLKQTLESKDYVKNMSSSEGNVTIPPVKLNSSKWDTIESMRAGYLDLSEKTTLSELLTAKETFDLNINPKENLRAMFGIDTETDIPEEKAGSKAQSQSQLNEDVIKEELLMEKVINENDENSKHVDTTVSLDKEIETSQEQLQSNFSTTDKLSVKPINGERSKNTSLYTVNPNYKPLKKIEVQPPKLFVRDPDDNSWRNESLSSLGIVFKPKNSSKPFTQVLKNKTESEWNNLSEKDSKNDIPDLRERLQKMTEKRKSKRKKTDSFGNVVYFDYEENSNSVENTSKEELAPTSTPEISSTTLNSSSEEPPATTSPISLTTDNKSIEVDSYTTKKYKKFFNVPEYYDTTEEDDTDYLNMAKIDIKRFSTSKKTTTHTTSAPATHTTPIWTTNRTPLTNPPGRKATIQYFPPLTTQKVSINDYDNNFQYRVNSFTETESPKNVLPVNPTTPENNVIQYKPNIHNERFDDYAVTTKPHFDKNVYLTQPPLTTQTGYTLLTEDGAFDRDAYVIRNYKDFVNMAAKNNEFERNLDYIPYTQAPMEGITKADVTYETEKPKLNMDEEYEYESQFRKDVLQRFVENFNQNTDRFKGNFPVLFNNSVIHRDTHGGGEVASSRAFMRGLYNDVKPRHPHKQPCDPNCEKMTVELSPAYELHYYMPEQEEKEEAVSPPVTLPYPYRL
ncbi:unnamed protein product, partial [Brenthis ino]